MFEWNAFDEMIGNGAIYFDKILYTKNVLIRHRPWHEHAQYCIVILFHNFNIIH